MSQDAIQDNPRIRTVRHEFSLRSLFSIVLVLAGCWVIIQIWPIILLLVIALILAGTLSPFITWMERYHIPRSIALGLALLMLVLVVAGFAALIIPALVSQMGMLVTNSQQLQDQLVAFLTSVPLLASSAAAVRDIQPQHLLDPLSSSAITIAGVAVQSILFSLTTVVLTVYLLADPQHVKGFAFALLPRSFHLRAARILLEMQDVVGGYVRGQALTSLLIGLFVFVMLWAVGTPAPLALAMFAAFADLIPFVGAVLIFIPIVLATFSQGVIPTTIVALLITIYMQLEAHVIIPRIYGQTLRLSPIAVVVALLIGGQLLGIVGALLALPIAASIRVIIEQLRIELPGEQPGEDIQRALDAQAEAVYAEQTEGISAREAAVVATEMAEQAQEEELTALAVEPPIPEGSELATPA